MDQTAQALWDGREVHVCAPGGADGAEALSAEALREKLSENNGDSGESRFDALLLSAGHPGQIQIDDGPVIQTLAWGPAEGVEVLLALAGEGEKERSLFNGTKADRLCIPRGQSVRFWGQLAALVMELLDRRQFYPDLEEGPDGELSAVWRPLLGGKWTDLLPRFADTMPPACRGVRDLHVAESSLQVEPLRRVESFINRAVDQWIRRAVSFDPFFDRPHELAGQFSAPMEVRWLSALLGADSRVGGESADKSILLEQVRHWTGRLDDRSGRIPWRLCITLHEPELEENGNPASASWRLSFQLQSPEEESQVIESADLFAQQPPSLLERTTAHHRAQLVSELSRAAALCPPLERLEAHPAPAGLELSPTEAHLFIRRWSDSLRQQEIRCFVPQWAGNDQGELGLVLNLRPEEAADEDSSLPVGDKDGGPVDLSSGRLGLGSLLHFDWQVAVGDLTLSIHDFARMVEQQQPLVRLEGRWLEIDPRSAQAAMEFLQQQATGKMTMAQALRRAYGASRTEAGLPVLGVRGAGWLADFLEQTPPAAMQELRQPDQFGGMLRPYQLRGLQWLVFLDQLGVGACLADDMGLGKTIQLIALLLHERTPVAHPPAGAAEQAVGPTLLFAPTSVVGNWQRELERFAPSLRVMVYHGPGRLSGEAFVREAKEHDVVLTSYALAHRDHAELSGLHWHRLALDEAQKIKNPSAASSVAIRTLDAGRRLALTGTPIENHLSELWSIMDLLNPGLLGSAAEFRERFAIPIERMADQPRTGQLRKLIRPFILRRTKSDPQIAGDLPEKMEMKVFCNLTPEQAGLYQRITTEMLGRIDAASGIRRRGLILAALTRLKQICDHPALLQLSGESAEHAAAISAGTLSGRSGKAERLVEMLEEVLEEGDAALIFTQYRQMGHLLEKILHQRLHAPMLFLHGGTPARQRQAMIDRFQKPGGEHRLFILSLRAGGLGLNLTAANHVFHFDRWWNPAVEAQATDRAHRLGQTRTVQVHKFICAGTVEERIDRLLGDKLALADRIVSSGDEWLTNLSTDELRNYLMLSQDAVGDFES